MIAKRRKTKKAPFAFAFGVFPFLCSTAGQNRAVLNDFSVLVVQGVQSAKIACRGLKSILINSLVFEVFGLQWQIGKSALPLQKRTSIGSASSVRCAVRKTHERT
jgi:hypothetical protein